MVSSRKSFSDFQLEEAKVLKSLSKVSWFDKILNVRLGQSSGIDDFHGVFHLGVILLLFESIDDEYNALTSWGNVFSSVDNIEKCCLRKLLNFNVV